MGLKSIASRTEEVVPIFAISKLIMEPVKKKGDAREGRWEI